MKINRKNNLILNYYKDEVKDRNLEILTCFMENLNNDYINNIVVISTENDYSSLIENLVDNKNKIIPILTEVRPTYNDYFSITRDLFNNENNINIISNLDIIIPKETLYSEMSKTINDYIDNKTCLALSRWNIQKDNTYVHFDRSDSQDTWIFLGGVPNIDGADFTLGKRGCDNKISYLLDENGYHVINPSKTLKTYHLHLTNIRNYLKIVDIIPRPYKLLKPTF
jgi:hypothetical protein